MNDIFILPSLHDADIVTPAFKQAFMEMDLNIFNKPLKIFKNMRSFFEQNERENMKNAFYDVLKPYAEEYLQEANQLMKESYQEQ